jgi:hypothetical protein
VRELAVVCDRGLPPFGALAHAARAAHRVDLSVLADAAAVRQRAAVGRGTRRGLRASGRPHRKAAQEPWVERRSLDAPCRRDDPRAGDLHHLRGDWRTARRGCRYRYLASAGDRSGHAVYRARHRVAEHLRGSRGVPVGPVSARSPGGLERRARERHAGSGGRSVHHNRTDAARDLHPLLPVSRWQGDPQRRLRHRPDRSPAGAGS